VHCLSALADSSRVSEQVTAITEGKAARVAASEPGQRASFNRQVGSGEPPLPKTIAKQKRGEDLSFQRWFL